MKKTALVFMALLAGSALASVDKIPFADTYDIAIELAVQKDQHVVVTFYTDW